MLREKYKLSQISQKINCWMTESSTAAQCDLTRKIQRGTGFSDMDAGMWLVLAFFKIELWNFQDKLSSLGRLNGAVKCNVFNWEIFAKCTKLGKNEGIIKHLFCFLS